LIIDFTPESIVSFSKTSTVLFIVYIQIAGISFSFKDLSFIYVFAPNLSNDNQKFLGVGKYENN
jgi:hypothetical protein